MDVSKLDKMKVVDLRNELQARGLDTKGVKAVLVERLRAFLEGGEGENVAPSTPTGTPAKRSRRTRSMTRSPSPSPKKVMEPELEALPEEENETVVAVEEEFADTADDAVMEGSDEQTDEQPMEYEQNVEEESPANEQQDSVEDEEEEEEEEKQQASIEQADNDNTLEQEVETRNGNQVETAEEVKPAEVDEQKNNDEQDEEMKAEKSVDEKSDADGKNKNADDTDADEEKPRRKRSHSASSQHSHHSKERRLSKSKDENLEDEPTIEDKQYGLSWFDSDLYLRIDPVTFTSAKPMSHDIFSIVWAGARANYGVREGKVCFEVRLAEETNMNRSHQFRDEPFARGFRVGFSKPNTKLLLGEDEDSFAYCETGRKVLKSEFSDYGKPYQLDDVIGCYLDLESSPCNIKYTLNGVDLGVAFEFDKSILGEEDALFPHIVTKGYEFIVNFADNENLLVNAERPKRMRRKPKPPKKILTDENNEKWEIVDETKPDELEKIGNADEEMKDEAEETTKKSTSDAVETNENEKVEENEETVKTDIPANTNDVDTSEAPANGDAKANNDETVEEKSEEKPVGTDEGSGTATADTKENESTNDEERHNKRRRTESSSNNKHDQHSEDEYEEIIPEPRDPANLLPGYELIALIPEERYIPGPQRPESRKECEVVLLVGLPGSGKTHWTLNRLQEQPEKRYHVIGADALISKMTIDGEELKNHHKSRWDKVYELCLNCLSSLEDIAMKRRRNFILDQTNAYASAQRRKMKGFGDFKRIAVVCIPNADELKRRNDEKTEKGTAQNIRESTLNNLRANFTLPSLEFGWFDDILYTDLSGDEAKEEVKKYIEKGKKALDANRDKRNRNNRRYDDHRSGGGYRGNTGWQDNRNDRRRYDDRGGGYRGNSGWRDNRSGGYDNRRYDGGGGGGYRNNSGGGGGGGYRDNRNNRYGGGGGGSSNWVQNNRNNRYDDRYGGGGNGGNRHRDNYGGGGGGGSGNYRSSGSSSSRNQRDFRPGHHDNRSEGSRGGYDSASGAASSGRYDQYSSSGSSKKSSNGGSSKSGKYAYPAQQGHDQQNQLPHQQQQQQWQQWQQYQQQQVTPEQQQQWGGYGGADMQAYANQWQNDPSQQQQWMSWYQQQGNAQVGGEASHYWSQYSYPTSNSGATGGGAEAKK